MKVGLENEIREMLSVYRSQFKNKGICYFLMEGNIGIEMEWQPYADQKAGYEKPHKTDFEFFFAENGFPDASSCDLRGNALLQRYPVTKKLEETSGRYKTALKEFLVGETDKNPENRELKEEAGRNEVYNGRLRFRDK